MCLSRQNGTTENRLITDTCVPKNRPEAVVDHYNFSTGWEYEGFLPKILAIGGIIAVLKGVFFLRSKAADKVTEWILKQPGLFFKIFAVCQMMLGLLIVFELQN